MDTKIPTNILKKELLWPGVLAIIFLIASWWLPWTTPQIFNSPDEMANAYFSRQVAEHSRLSVAAPLNLELNDRVYPRSIKSSDGFWRPWSFIGLPVFYGLLGKIFGVTAIRYFTGIFAALGGLIFYLLLRRFFNQRWALLGYLMLLFHPAYFYYTARGMFHNVFFVDLALAALFFYGLTGALLMLAAVAVRTFEGLWLWPLLVWVKDRRFKIMAVAAVIINLVLLWWIRPGYPTELFPFGLSWRRILANIWHINFGLLYWYTLPAIVGAVLWIRERQSKKYLLVGGAVAAWLSFYYGTYVIRDNPSGELTVVSSLFRYWLPIFILEIPLVLLLLKNIYERLASRTFWRWSAVAVGGMIFLILGINRAWFGSDGLLNVQKNITHFGEVKSAVLPLVEPEAVIISDRGTDKIFFPERAVMYDLHDSLNLPQYKKLVSLVPAYYYGIGLAHTDPILKALKEQGLELKRVEIFGKEALYRLKIKNEK